MRSDVAARLSRLKRRTLRCSPVLVLVLFPDKCNVLLRNPNSERWFCLDVRIDFDFDERLSFDIVWIVEGSKTCLTRV